MWYISHTPGGCRAPGKGGLDMIKRLKALRLRVEFGMWLGVAVAAYAFALALWRVLGLPGMAAGAVGAPPLSFVYQKGLHT